MKDIIVERNLLFDPIDKRDLLTTNVVPTLNIFRKVSQFHEQISAAAVPFLGKQSWW